MFGHISQWSTHYCTADVGRSSAKVGLSSVHMPDDICDWSGTAVASPFINTATYWHMPPVSLLRGRRDDLADTWPAHPRLSGAAARPRAGRDGVRGCGRRSDRPGTGGRMRIAASGCSSIPPPWAATGDRHGRRGRPIRCCSRSSTDNPAGCYNCRYPRSVGRHGMLPIKSIETELATPPGRLPPSGAPVI